MQSALASNVQISRVTVWTARVFYVLTTAFMLFDAGAKYVIAPGVAAAFQRQGMPLSLASLIATIELICVALYLIPRTSAFGAVVLTGYFGGACACNLRAGFSPFETIFPVLFCVLVWVPIYLLNPEVRYFIPLRRR